MNRPFLPVLARRTTVIRLIHCFLYVGFVLLPFSSKPGEGSVVVSFGLPFFALACFFIFVRLTFIKITKNMTPLLMFSSAYVLSMAVSSLISPAVIASLWRVSHNIIGFLVFLHIISLSKLDQTIKKQHLTKLLRLLVMSGTLMSLYYFTNFMWAVWGHGMLAVISQRYTGGLMSLPWGASNTIAASMLIPVIAAIASFQIDVKTRLWSVFAVTLMSSAILLTFSRTVIIILLVLFISLAFIKSKKSGVLSVVAILTLIFVVGFSSGVGFDDPLLGQRLKMDVLITLNGRIPIWEEKLVYFSENPFSPVGYYASLFVFGHSSHNYLVNVLIEQGIIGLLISLLFFSYILLMAINGVKTQKKQWGSFSCVFLLGITLIFFNLQLEDVYFLQQYTIYFWTILGIFYLGTHIDSRGRALKRCHVR